MLIAFTGGPCGGKTTCIDLLKKDLLKQGVRVVVIPEVASLLAATGLHPAVECRASPERRYNYHQMMFDMQLQLEDFALRSLNLGGDTPCVILCDRGAMDLKSYSNTFDKLLRGRTEAQVLQRYGAVLHLQSTAVDKPEAYNLTTNIHRHESQETAAWRDTDLKRAWESHPQRMIIGNEGDMEGKYAEVLQQIQTLLRPPLEVDL